VAEGRWSSHITFAGRKIEQGRVQQLAVGIVGIDVLDVISGEHGLAFWDLSGGAISATPCCAGSAPEPWPRSSLTRRKLAS
jgi:hypothetical protein